jgi:CspA family cold shock protein
VKWYDKSKGYGFIESPEGDVFFHFSDIQMEGFKALAEDQRVSYKQCRGEQGLKAKEIRPLDNRAAVRHAARYRTLLSFQIAEGKEGVFDEIVSKVPAWMDALEQDLGMRSIGTWRHKRFAVRLYESDRPYEQTIESAHENPHWVQYQAWLDDLRKLLVASPEMMEPLPMGSTAEGRYASETADEVVSRSVSES